MTNVQKYCLEEGLIMLFHYDDPNYPGEYGYRAISYLPELKGEKLTQFISSPHFTKQELEHYSRFVTSDLQLAQALQNVNAELAEGFRQLTEALSVQD